MVLQQATQRGAPSVSLVGFLAGITFEYVMFVVSLQECALGAWHPVGLSVLQEHGCTYNQGKGYLMYAGAMCICCALTSG